MIVGVDHNALGLGDQFTNAAGPFTDLVIIVEVVVSLGRVILLGEPLSGVPAVEPNVGQVRRRDGCRSQTMPQGGLIDIAPTNAQCFQVGENLLVQPSLMPHLHRYR